MATAAIRVVEPAAFRTLTQSLRRHQFVVLQGNSAGPDSPVPTIGFVECSSLEPDAFERILQMRRRYPATPVVAVARHGSEDLAVAALRAGACDYLRCPLHEEDIAKALQRCRVTGASTSLEGVILGHSRSILDVVEAIHRAATTDTTVLITGETGTGKELIAQTLHQTSARRHGPFVCINCAAIPDTLIESELFGHERGAFTDAAATRAGSVQQAETGTLFLDEIGDLSLQAQAKLLRAVETRQVTPLGGDKGRHVNVRFAAATNQNLEAMTRNGQFRADLLFRLDVVRIQVPPLRERAGDIPELARHFVDTFNRVWGKRLDGFTDDASNTLLEYSWPGNVRELKNVVETVYVNAIGPIVDRSHLPVHVQGTSSRRHEPRSERDVLTEALNATDWNLSKAAERLRWSRMTVYRKLARYQIRRQKAEAS